MDKKILIALVLDKEKDAITVKNMLDDVADNARSGEDVLHYFDNEAADKLLSVGALRVLNVPSLEIEDIPASEYLANKPPIVGLHDSICVTRLELNMMGFSDDEEFNEHIQNGGRYSIYPCIYNEKVIVPDGEYFEDKVEFNSVTLVSMVYAGNEFASNSIIVRVYLDDGSVRVCCTNFDARDGSKRSTFRDIGSFYTLATGIGLECTFGASNDAIRCVSKGILAIYNSGYIYNVENDLVLPNYLEFAVMDLRPDKLINIVFPPSIKEIALGFFPNYCNAIFNVHKDFAKSIKIFINRDGGSGDIRDRVFSLEDLSKIKGLEVRLYG